MNTENLYYGEIREVKALKGNKTLHVDNLILPRSENVQNKEINKKTLKTRLDQLKEKVIDDEQLINTDKLFVGYLLQVAPITYSFDYNDNFIEQLFNLARDINDANLKKTLLLKEGFSEYRDIKTGKQYKDYLLSEGDVIVLDSQSYPLTPFNNYLTEEEKCKEMPKKKVLSKFQKIK